ARTKVSATEASRYSSRYSIALLHEVRELADLPQRLPRPCGRLAVDGPDGEAHVHQDEVAGSGVGLIGEADLAQHAAEAHLAEGQAIPLDALDQFAGDGQAHARLPPPLARQNVGGDGGLAEGDAAVVRRPLPGGEHLEAADLEVLRRAFEEDAVLEASAAQNDRGDTRLPPREFTSRGHGARHRLVEAPRDGACADARGVLGEQGADGGAQIDLEVRAGSDLEGEGIGRNLGEALELGGRLAVVARRVAHVEQGRDRVEPTARARGGREGVAAKQAVAQRREGALSPGRRYVGGCTGVDAGGERDPPGVLDGGGAAGQGQGAKRAEAPVALEAGEEEL